jgi:chromosomal replication initiator protein
VNPDAAHIWPSIQNELKRAVPEHTYELWLAPLRLVAIDGETLVVEAPEAMRARVADRFARVLQSCASAVLGPRARVDVIAPGAVPRETSAASPDPLFIYGPPGVGKTHLLHAIGNYVRLYGAGLSVRYTTIEAFTNAFVWALHGGDIERFKARFRRTDVLLIDDVQFLESKVKTEEEFFHTFNALHDTNSQLVLTSDRLPRDLDALHDRLRERFEAGLVTDIQPPDLATRMTVLRNRARHDGAAVSEDVLATIARRIQGNIRALEGALIRVIAYASLTSRPMDAELADTVLDGFYGPAGAPGRPGSRPAPSVEAIQDAVCDAFAISRDELLSSSRTARVVWPRQVAMYLARESTDLTFPDIARSFGGRNHTTVMHAVRRTADRLTTDREAFDTVRRLTERLHGATSVGPDRQD